MISLNTLHIDSDPRLIFMSNSIENKGRSNKSYTIKIVRDGYNDTILNNIFSSRTNRISKFDCSYDIQGITMLGVLIVDTIGETYAQGVFVSGNGKLWETLANKNLRDYDWSAWSHVLNLTNVRASESGGKYIYDLCDRGEWVQDNLVGIGSAEAIVDISERYPSMNIIEMLTTILNEETTGLTVTSVPGLLDVSNAYLLFTGDKDIRNSADWLKSTLFQADSVSGAELVDTGAFGIGVPFSINDYFEFKTEVFDDGSNFPVATGKLYTIPETGTYRFVSPYSFVYRKPTTAAFTVTTCEVSIRRNSTDIFKQTITIPLTWDGTYDVSGVLDCKFREFTAGDTVGVHALFEGTITHGSTWTVDIQQVLGCSFYNNVTRYYGYGSTVDFSKIVPDMTALQFISDAFNYLNVYTFYREELLTLEIRHGRTITNSAIELELLQVTESINETQNIWIRYNTDKAAPLLDEYIDNSGDQDSEVKYNFSRTTIGACRRLFGETTSTIPLLWESKELDPTDMRYRYTPPKYVTKGNLRIMIYQGAAGIGANYDLSYGGSVSANVSNLKAFPAFTEPDTELYHRYDLSLEGATIKAIAKIDLDGLYDQTYFKNPVWCPDFGLYWIVDAEQIEDNIYRLTLESAGQVNGTINIVTTLTEYILTLAGDKILTLDDDYVIV